MPIIDQAVGAGLGMLTADWQDRRQIRQQQKLQAIEIQGAKEMGAYNQGLALDTWNKTNYEAQRKHLEKAGLNVGLMYGTAGQGGTTSTPTGSVTGAQAPVGGGEIGMGMQLGLQSAMMAAQIENIKATTEKTKADTDKTKGVDTEAVQTGIDALKQTTANAKIQQEVLEFEKQLKQIEFNIADQTQYEIIGNVTKAADKLYGEAQSAMAKGETDQATKDTIQTQIRQAATEQTLRILAQKQGLIKGAADIKAVNQGISKMAKEIEMLSQAKEINWERLNQNEREVYVKEKLLKLQALQTEFNTSTPEQIKQWTGIITEILKMTPTPKPTPIEFK